MTEPEARCGAASGLPPELIERFRRELARLWPEGGRLGLAVSGGPDSMALLLLADAAMPGRFEVATVDHGLRAGSPAECAFVAEQCDRRGIPCGILRVSVDAGNVQAQARKARYQALGRWAQGRGLSAIATAHHADDQAETLLMRLNRASGVAGLAGVRERSELEVADVALPLIRPLLAFRRQELASIVANASIQAVDDPSNGNDAFDRVRLRKALAQAPWIDPPALAQSASHLADAEAALRDFAAMLWSQRVRQEGEGFTFDPPSSRLMRLRLAERIIRQLGGDPRGGDVARLVEALEAGKQGNVAGVLAVASRPDRWTFRPEPPRRA